MQVNRYPFLGDFPPSVLPSDNYKKRLGADNIRRVCKTVGSVANGILLLPSLTEFSNVCGASATGFYEVAPSSEGMRTYWSQALGGLPVEAFKGYLVQLPAPDLTNSKERAAVADRLANGATAEGLQLLIAELQSRVGALGMQQQSDYLL